MTPFVFRPTPQRGVHSWQVPLGGFARSRSACADAALYAGPVEHADARDESHASDELPLLPQ